MYCDNCGSSRTRTLETRDSPGNTIRRRKVCRNCGHNFSTVERIEVYVEGQWVRPEEKIPDLQLVGPPAEVPALVAEAAAVAKDTAGKLHQPPRYWPVELGKVAPGMGNLPADLQEQIVTWWNTARRAKHGTKATWTKKAWELSAHRMVALWNQGHGDLVRQLIEEANENGWQALKLEYIQPKQGFQRAPAAPAPAGLVPRNAAMQQAVETWDSAA
jgi:hypothetical protein